jgi:hypothetical protein
MLTVKDVIDFLQALPPDMQVPAMLAQFGGADYLNLAFERLAVEDQQRQVQQEADKAYESYVAYKDAHQNIPIDSDLFMEAELLQNDLLNVSLRRRSVRPCIHHTPTVRFFTAA